MVDHTSSREELNAYWLEKNATSKWDQGHTHYVEPNDDERSWPSDCPACREQKLDGIEGDIDFWEAPWWNEEQIRKAFAWWLRPELIDKAMAHLKESE